MVTRVRAHDIRQKPDVDHGGHQKKAEKEEVLRAVLLPERTDGVDPLDVLGTVAQPSAVKDKACIVICKGTGGVAGGGTGRLL